MPGPSREVSIRPARPDDYDAIVALWQAAKLPTDAGGRDARAPFLVQRAQFPDLYLVAEGAASDGIVGVILGTHDGRKGWINRLAVHPDHRRKGIAAALIAAAEHALRRAGIEIVAALVHRDNDASYGFFRSIGYVDDVPVHYVRKLFRASAEPH